MGLKLEADWDPAAIFRGSSPTYGSRSGLAARVCGQAENHRDIGVIGAEPYVSVVAKLLSKLSARTDPTRNVRLYMEDARDIIEALPRASIGRVFILFPDPWPKARHHKRRFIQMAMLDELARIMKPGGEIRFATDDTGYLAWALERFAAHPSFAWLARDSADWRTRPADWPETRYEAKAIREGSACTYLRFIRR